MYEIKNSKKVELTDRVRFKCKRCAECCKNVEGAVVLEVKDAYYISKFLNISVPEFYEKYARMFLLEEVGFPIFALKTTGKDDACIFLKGKRCTVQSVKPRTCKMYPFWVFPDDNDKFEYNLSTERRHHPNGSLIRVKDWMKNYLSEEDMEYLIADRKYIAEIAPIFNMLSKIPENSEILLSKILTIRYFMYEHNEPFYQQFCRNNEILKNELKHMLENQMKGRI